MVNRVINYNPPLFSFLPFVIRCTDKSYIAVQTWLHRLSSWPGFDTSALITCIFKSVSGSLGGETRTPWPALLRQSVPIAPLRKSRFVHVKDSECIRVLLTRMLNKPVVEWWTDFAIWEAKLLLLKSEYSFLYILQTTPEFQSIGLGFDDFHTGMYMVTASAKHRTHSALHHKQLLHTQAHCWAPSPIQPSV